MSSLDLAIGGASIACAIGSMLFLGRRVWPPTGKLTSVSVHGSLQWIWSIRPTWLARAIHDNIAVLPGTILMGLVWRIMAYHYTENILAVLWIVGYLLGIDAALQDVGTFELLSSTPDYPRQSLVWCTVSGFIPGAVFVGVWALTVGRFPGSLLLLMGLVTFFGGAHQRATDHLSLGVN